jgi:hypothetical protein
MTDRQKIERLRNQVFWLRQRIKILKQSNKEQRKWITKLTAKGHPARIVAK